MRPILVRTHAVALTGIAAHVIQVETHVGSGLVSFNLVGMPDASVRESRDRVRAALQTCGIDWFEHRVTINLSPAGIPKAGSAFDLAIAVGLLAARGVLSPDAVDGIVFMAELGLDGSLRPIRGVLPAVMGVRAAGFKKVVVASDCLTEATLLPGVEVLGFTHLRDLVAHFGGRLLAGLPMLPPINASHEGAVSQGVRGSSDAFEGEPTRGGHGDSAGVSSASGVRGSQATSLDLLDVRGQALATEALLIAAAGGHNMMMVGEPGSGKTMLASRLPTVLPPLSDEGAIEVTAIHSISGTFDPTKGLMRTPPIESPHHSATMAAIIGGGSGIPRPGAISRAHAGVLLLDEAAEFAPAVLDALRQPLESGIVNLQRARHHVQYPARFQLVLATNPCPCGHFFSRRKACTCSSMQQRRYVNRLSGPLLDRVDLQITMMTPSPAELEEPPKYSSSDALKLVTDARGRAAKRWAKMPWSINAHIPARALKSEEAGISKAVRDGIRNQIIDGALSMRGADRVLRVARTLADLRDQDTVGIPELQDAIKFRNGVLDAFA